MYTNSAKWNEIRQRVEVDGESVRGIARSEGMSRKTVRKMLREDCPGRYTRSAVTTAITGYKALIDALLLEDEDRPQNARRSCAAIFRILCEDHAFTGGYDSVRRYCRSVQVPNVSVEIRTAGAAGGIDALQVVRLKRVYQVSAAVDRAPSRVELRVHRDRRAERAAEVANWIDRLRAGRACICSAGSSEEIRRLLGAVHGKGSRIRNRAIAVLAHEQGFPMRQIAACLGMSKNTVRRHVHTYRDGGADKLLMPMVRKRAGVDRDHLTQAVFRLLHEPPKDHGVNRTAWIMPDLQAVLTRQGHPACLHVIRRIIHDAGWKWRKARIVLTSQDPAYREKLGAVQAILSKLGPDEAFFSIDEFGPFAVKMKPGLMLGPPGPHRVVPQWQKSKGCMIMTAALELSGNQVTHFYSDRKNTTEMIRMMNVLLEQYADRRTLYLSWDAASWHVSKKLMKRIDEHNDCAEVSSLPRVMTAPLPAGAQFLNVIESIFSGMAKAVIHNSDYPTVDAARAAIDRYFADRNQQFQDHPKRAGKRIWGEERVPPTFSDSNNCKDPGWR